jgi:hypothetical protein
MYSSIKKAKYKDGNLGAYHFKPSHHCRACMQIVDTISMPYNSVEHYFSQLLQREAIENVLKNLIMLKA